MPGRLTSAGATDVSGMTLHSVLQDMAIHNGAAGTVGLFFTGKLNGNDMIVQPYQVPAIAWWMACYDLAYVSVNALHILDTLHTIIELAEKLLDVLKSEIWRASVYQSGQERPEQSLRLDFREV